MNTMLKKSLAVFASAAILATTSVTAFAEEAKTEAATNYDAVVWIGAKDVKAKKGTGDFDTLMKTEQVGYVGPYAGGKQQVAVVKKDAASDASAFVKLLDEKGKLAKATADEGKKIASAKMKEGVITVTAGKEGGEVDVWVYEIRNKAVVNGTVASGYKKSVNGTDGTKVEPVKIGTYTVKQAVTGPMFLVGKESSGNLTDTPDGITAPKDTTNGVATIAKGDKAVNLAIKGDAKQKATIYIADKKVEASKDNTWEILTDDKSKYDDKIVTPGTVPTSLDSSSKTYKLELTAAGEGKTTVNIKNKESGKILKVNVVVTKWLNVKASASGIKMTVEGGTAKDLSTSGEYVAPKTKVTFDKKVKVDGKEYDAGKAVTITKDTVVEEVKAEANA